MKFTKTTVAARFENHDNKEFTDCVVDGYEFTLPGTHFKFVVHKSITAVREGETRAIRWFKLDKRSWRVTEPRTGKHTGGGFPDTRGEAVDNTVGRALAQGTDVLSDLIIKGMANKQEATGTYRLTTGKKPRCTNLTTGEIVWEG